jgi:hypothetical protein
MADIDMPDEIKGMSFFQQLFPLQHQINACASLIYKSLVLFAHPKWVMMDGTCDINQLLNESTVVSYSGVRHKFFGVELGSSFHKRLEVFVWTIHYPNTHGNSFGQ